MRNTAQNLTTRLAVTFVLASAAQVAADEDEQLRIVLHVDDFSGISAADRSAAAVEVTRIYARAGVNTLWATGSEHADAAGLHVRVRLLSRSMAEAQIDAEGLTHTIVGKAAREARHASIFTFQILTLALREGENFRLALGRVIAHEVGHLLLPPNSHAAHGIMRASPSVRSNGSYDFTTDQGVAIRSMLRGRFPAASRDIDNGGRSRSVSAATRR